MKTLIIGGGLSGLALADMLQAQGRDYLLLEARDRFGGRIMTKVLGDGYFDLGPAWFWPGQPRIAALIQRSGLRKFDQYANGMMTFEDERGQVERSRGFVSMQGSWRLEGGLQRLTQALAERLPEARKRLGAQVTDLALIEDGVRATLSSGEKLETDQAVLCLPPRVASKICFAPALPDAALKTMGNIATWMAGQAKAVAVYDTPFWREEGLSGEAMSRHGPLIEIHDASPATCGPYALFGFVGLPPERRRDEQTLRQNVVVQFARLFGPKAAEPRALYIKDWALDPNTSTVADQHPLYAHPTYGLAPAMTGLWDGKLHFGGTEMAPQFGGYLEGALEAAENVLSNLRT